MYGAFHYRSGKETLQRGLLGMQHPRTLKRHAALVDGMATARGIDLEETLMRGEISVDEISDAVLRCTACSNPEHCAGWLEEQDGVAESVLSQRGPVQPACTEIEISLYQPAHRLCHRQIWCSRGANCTQRRETPTGRHLA